MAEETDEATNELIARILAADNDQFGYEDFGNADLSDDSDYGEQKKKKTKRGGTKPGAKAPPAPQVQKRKSAEVAMGEGVGVIDAAAEFTASGRRKRKDTGAKREGAAKGWTEDEERLFLEGLEFFGREWHKAAAHVGTRDKKAFTSHAQKHFIKLCIADRPLPQKVVETGSGDGLGYTLSGLPLDPNSASAKSYGLKPEHVQRLVASGGPGSKGLLLPGKENDADAVNAQQVPAVQPHEGKEQDAEKGVIRDRAEEEIAAPVGCKQPDNPRPAPKPAASKPVRQGKPQPQTRPPPEEPVGPREPTEYVKNRPRRWGDTTESLELVRCHDFIGPPGSGASLAQPFEVVVDGQVNLVMDFHAHLCGCEVIGLLGGEWAPRGRRIAVRAAFPCRRLEGSHSGTSVEVDPRDQVRVMHLMEQRGLVSVGWYHSHPIFSPTPSRKDNENQRNQQVLHKCPATGLEPCLGAIVGPYDTTLPSEASAITWFVVQKRGSQLVPFTVRQHCLPPGPELPNPDLEACLQELIEVTAADPDRVDFNEEWRPFRLLVDGQPQGGRLTNLSKMRLAIAHHLRGDVAAPKAEAAASFLDTLVSRLKQTWGIPSGRPAVPAAMPNAQPALAAEETAAAAAQGLSAPEGVAADAITGAGGSKPQRGQLPAAVKTPQEEATADQVAGMGAC